MSRDHSAASCIAGDAVSRGPIPSVRSQARSITCDRWRPSSRIRLTASRSTGSAAPHTTATLTTMRKTLRTGRFTAASLVRTRTRDSSLSSRRGAPGTGDSRTRRTRRRAPSSPHRASTGRCRTPVPRRTIPRSTDARRGSGRPRASDHDGRPDAGAARPARRALPVPVRFRCTGLDRIRGEPPGRHRTGPGARSRAATPGRRRHPPSAGGR